MSLHTLAHHLQSAGRGDDKVLVHMTPGEVNGLQSLAMAHGGSLTINPQTGLPEAGFLSSLLPMLAGGALTVMSGGAINPLTAGFLVGGGTAAVTGSLKKGLLAGLGAYSGAGLGAGLTSMGTSAAAPTTSFSAPTSVAPQVAGTANTVAPATTTAGAPTEIFSGGISRPPLALQGAGPGGYGAAQPGIFTPGSYGGTAIPAPTPGPVTASRVPSELYSGVETSTRPWMTNLPQANPPIDLQSYQTAGKMPDAVRTVTVPSTGAYEPVGTKFDITGTTKAAVNQPQLETYTYKPGDYLDPGSFTTVEAPTQSAMDKLGAGFKKATTDGLQGLKDLRAASEAAAPYGMYAGLGSTAYTMYEEKRKKIEEEMRRRKAEQDTGMIRPYTFDYGATNIAATPYGGSAERTYFQPSYTALTPYKAPGPEYAAEGGLMGLAVGGAVEEMAAQNAIGANTGYPMANLQTPMYSNPSVQRPETGNVIAPSADMGVNMYTGEATFRSGGATKEPETTGEYSYTYNPVTMQYTQTGAPQPVVTGRANTGYGMGSAYGGGSAPAQTQSEGRSIANWNEGSPFNLVSNAAANMSMPVNGTVSGGIRPPVIQPTSSAQSMVPNIDIPAYQTPEEQLGLVDFYKNMNQTFGGYKGYASGGDIPRLRPASMNKKMAAVAQARAKMQTRQGQMEIEKAARDGDYSAQMALQMAGYDMNQLNQYATGGGISHLGDYSDGGRLLKGPGDGVSDSIPASIGNRQPARLADGEFVVPARIVSEIGNGSTEAGARKLYAMMDRVQRARRKTTGKGKVAVNTKAEKLLPA